MKATFNIRENGFFSAATAAVLVVATFSILPISLVGIERQNKKFEYTKVYSVPSGTQKSKPSERAETALKTPPLRADVPQISISKMSVDFSQSGALTAELSTGNADVGDRLFAMGSDAENSFSNASFELSELDSIPKLLKGAKIKYPQKLFKRGIEGEVRLNVEIDEHGRVDVLGVASSTDALFSKAALDAAPEFLYETPKKNGKAVRAKFILPIPFKISEL